MADSSSSSEAPLRTDVLRPKTERYRKVPASQISLESLENQPPHNFSDQEDKSGMSSQKKPVLTSKKEANATAGNPPTRLLKPQLPPPLERSSHSSVVEVCSVFGVYVCVAILMVLVNKLILTSLPHPLTCMWGQSLCAVVALGVFSRCGFLALNMEDWREGCLGCPRRAALYVVNAGSILFAALCLKMVDASSFQVFARSLNTPFAGLISFFWLGDRVSPLGVVGCSIVTCGFMSALLLDSGGPPSSFQGPLVSVEGVFWGACAAFVSALHVSVIKWMGPDPKFSNLDQVWYMNLVYTALGLPLTLLVESDAAPLLLGDKSFWLASGVMGVLSAVFNMVVIRQVRVTSPTSHMIASGLRGVLQLYLLALILGEPLTRGKVAGTFIVILGGGIYAYAKSVQAGRK